MGDSLKTELLPQDLRRARKLVEAEIRVQGGGYDCTCIEDGARSIEAKFSKKYPDINWATLAVQLAREITGFPLTKAS